MVFNTRVTDKTGREIELRSAEIKDAEALLEYLKVTNTESKYLICEPDEEPGNEFTLVVGADNLAEIEKWREAPRLLSEYGLAVFPRRGFDIPSLAGALDKGARVQVVDAPMVDISSTEIREALANGKDMSAYMM